MAARRPARKPAKTVAVQGDSASNEGSKSVAGGHVSGEAGAKRGAHRRAPAAAGVDLTAGGRLRDALGRVGDEYAVTLLIDMAARHADRLEVIDRLLSGDQGAWCEVKIGVRVVEVRVTNLVVEERQRSAALHKILVDIGRMRGDVPAGPAAGGGKVAASPLARIRKARNA